MSRRTLSTGFSWGIAVGLCLTFSSTAAESLQRNRSSLNDLSMEVAALQALYEFQLTPEQMKGLRQLAPETAGKPGARQAAKASAEYAKTLVELHGALVQPAKAERIHELEEKLAELAQNEAPELDDLIELTEAACRRAPELLRQLSARQVASYIAQFEFPDPLELLHAALDQVRPLAPKEWKEFREELSSEVGRLVAGLDAERAGRVGDKVVQWLIQIRSLTEEEFKAQRSELERAARQIVGDLGPLDVLRHELEYALAELLSNPRLEAALAVRLR
jgi:hypothetical protein